ncbi:MAG: PD-(D/E)XK nuclease family protein [Candidatus Limnocylindria bacterium]
MAERWLTGQIREIQADDPLRPVTVAVQNHYVGLALQRRMSRGGFANVRFTRLPGLAESFGAPVLAARGCAPMTDIQEEGAIREALRRRGDGFGDVRQHRAVVEMLKRLFGELREREIDDGTLNSWSRASRMAAAALTTFAEYRRLLAEGKLYDQTDLMAAAVSGVAGPTHQRLREVGHVIVFLPQLSRPFTVRLLRALADEAPVDIALAAFDDELADGQAKAAAVALGLDWETLPPAGPAIPQAEVGIVIAPDPSGEVRVAVRQVAEALEDGVPLYRMAVLCGREEPYAALVRETLDAAGLPWAALEGRPLAESVVGRGLLGLLRLRDLDFSRRAVLDWRSTLPHAGRNMPSFSDWNRISRKAGVVRGRDGWARGLDRFTSGIRERLEENDANRSAAETRYLERELERAQLIAAEIDRIAADTEPPADVTWSALVEWAARCRSAHVPVPDSSTEREAADAVDDVVQKLRIADAFEERTTVATFIDTLEAGLTAARRPQGRMGIGITVGDATAALGMAFDRVHLIGLGEGVFPTPEPADPIFPNGDQLGRRMERLGEERRAFLGACAAADGGEVRLCVPSWDSSLRVTFAAPWLLEVCSRKMGRPLTSSELRKLEGPAWVIRVQSPSQSIGGATTLLDLAEWRIHEASRSSGSARLERSGLALREDLPLGRNLEVQRARRSRGLTAFDGHVHARPERGLARVTTSASAIQLWAACPFKYFMGRVLNVEATENPEEDDKLSMSPMLKGSLIHEILERFFQELHAIGRPSLHESYTRGDHARIEVITDEVFKKVEDGGLVGHVLSWANERHGILLDLHSTLTTDQDERGGLLPARFEQPFGMNSADGWGPAVVPLDSGGEALIRGYIDRLDLPPGKGAPEQALVLDYKSGKIPRQDALDNDPVLGGTQVQLAAYAVATRRWLIEQMAAEEPVVSAAYWGISAKEGFKRVQVTLDGAVKGGGRTVDGRLHDVLNIVDEGLRDGAFPQVPGNDTQRGPRVSWENCVYCPYTRICPSARDQLWRTKKDDPRSALHARLTLEAPAK